MRETNYGNLKVFYREKTADESVLEHSFDKDIFLSAISNYEIKNDATIIDVGAHIGTFSLLSATKYTDSKIYALEPCAETYGVLERNIISNNLQNRIKSLQKALDSETTTLKLYHDERTGNWGHSIVSELSNSYELVNTITLHSLFSNHSINHCDLIKFNCEGAEFRIIKDAPNDLINKIKLWIILFHEDLEHKINHQTIVEKFRENQFNLDLKFTSPDNKRGWIIANK